MNAPPKIVHRSTDDGSTIADLMNCFTKKEVNNPKFPEFSRRVNELKNTEGGVSAMCEVMEKYMAESKAEGIAEGQNRLLKKLIEQGILDVAGAARQINMPVEEFKKLL